MPCASRTLRGFKLEFEERREDYGLVVVYKGTARSAEKQFTLDGHRVCVERTDADLQRVRQTSSSAYASPTSSSSVNV